jgi:hypothetical protein
MTPRISTRIAALWTVLALQLQAAIKPAEQLLPSDTLAVITVPEFAKTSDAYGKSPMALLWNDPSMQPFREKFLGKLRSEAIAPLEQQLGLKLADFEGLIQGQLTLAIVQNGWEGTAEKLPAALVLLDARDKAEQLKKNLAALKKKWVDGGKTTKSEKIREVDFEVLSLDAGGMLPGDGAKDLPKFDIYVGMHDSLLLVSSSGQLAEKILARQAGGTVPCLAENSAFEADNLALFREAQAYGWMHFSPIATVLSKVLAELSKAADSNPMAPKPDKILASLGLLEIRTLAFASRQSADGASGELFIGVPADKRKGLLKMLANEAKPSAPPAFVPAEATEFTRWRLDGQKAWATLESTINEIAPGIMGFMMGQMEAALKEKDPSFDFRKNFVGNLGDDIVSYKKSPRGTKPEDFANQPQLTLIGSPDAEQLIQSLKSLLLMAPPMMSGLEFKERQLLGRKVYSMPIPTADGERTIEICAGGGYLAITMDAAVLEEYLRSADSKVKPLSELAGLNEAAAKVGGMGTGLFLYQNDAETMRAALEMLKSNSGGIEEAISEILSEAVGAEDAIKKFKEWVDLSMLPPWDKIGRFFAFTVMAGKTDAAGFRLSTFTPTPAGLK